MCLGHPSDQTWQYVISSCVGVLWRTVFTSCHSQRHYPELRKSATTPAIVERHRRHAWESFWRGIGEYRLDNLQCHTWGGGGGAHRIMHLRSLWNCKHSPFQTVLTSCVCAQYLWKYDFAKSSDNLYASCIVFWGYIVRATESLFKPPTDKGQFGGYVRSEPSTYAYPADGTTVCVLLVATPAESCVK
jgi:hypothetical protein